MKRTRLMTACLLAILPATRASAEFTPTPGRNAIIFIADGMRHSAVSQENTPTMMRIRSEGVDFVNSHSLYPTFTMPNASAIATGHLLGDTGQFSNTLLLGFPSVSGSMALGTEDDTAIRYINDHFDNHNYLNETTLLAAARAAGFHTAAIGKHGPTLLQDLTQNNTGAEPLTIIIDDATGSRSEVKLPAKFIAAAQKAGFHPIDVPEPRVVNVPQQQYLVNVATKAVLPAFLAEKEHPFVLLFWARDPDYSQHYTSDNVNRATGRYEKLGVGINGPSPQGGWRNSDRTLGDLLDYLDKTDDPRNPGKKLSANTNVFITSDHGFGTISRRDISADGTKIDNYASTIHYQHIAATRNGPAIAEAEMPGFLPVGFVGIDLAHHLKMTLWDLNTLSHPKHASSNPNADEAARTGIVQYCPVDPTQPPEGTTRRMYATGGNCILGGNGQMTYTVGGPGGLSGKLDPGAKLMTLASGGSEVIYLPNARIENGKASAEDVQLVQSAVAVLTQQKYTGAIFVDADVYGPVPGALSLSDIGLKGSARTPAPAIIVSFTTFSMDPKNPVYTGVEISDTTLEHSQGMHGSFARFDTFNNMMAIGPDFKKSLRGTDPISNADIAPTLAATLGIKLPSIGKLGGRIIEEALIGGREPAGAKSEIISAQPTPDGFQTDMRLQTITDSAGREYRYRTWAGMKGRVVTGE